MTEPWERARCFNNLGNIDPKGIAELDEMKLELGNGEMLYPSVVQ